MATGDLTHVSWRTALAYRHPYPRDHRALASRLSVVITEAALCVQNGDPVAAEHKTHLSSKQGHN